MSLESLLFLFIFSFTKSLQHNYTNSKQKTLSLFHFLRDILFYLPPFSLDMQFNTFFLFFSFFLLLLFSFFFVIQKPTEILFLLLHFFGIGEHTHTFYFILFHIFFFHLIITQLLTLTGETL